MHLSQDQALGIRVEANKEKRNNKFLVIMMLCQKINSIWSMKLQMVEETMEVSVEILKVVSGLLHSH